MSHIGKLSRGLKWWMHNRDLDGVLKPMISEDANKMLDVNFYLDYCKDKNQDKINIAIHQVYLLQHAPGGRQSKLYLDLKKKLIDGDFKQITKSKVKK